MIDNGRMGDYGPMVSIILPTYNRSRFLPRALEAIRSQQLRDWELLVIDDGSTDATAEVVDRFRSDSDRPVQYAYQKNLGAYAARNAGLDHAMGEYVAFYDSDDVWLPHHLDHCVAALVKSPEVDWVYAASRIVDEDTGRTLARSTFYEGDRARAFLRLRARDVGPLRIIEDPAALACAILQGVYCGLQGSVFRRRVFETKRFRTEPRNESEDQVFAVRALAIGHRLGYIDDVHLLYYVHDQNSSAAGGGSDPARTARVIRELISGYEALRDEGLLAPTALRALDRRLSGEYFWRLGYWLWRKHESREALAMYRRGLALWPWDLACWKTYLLALLRHSFSARRSASTVVAEGPAIGQRG